MTLQKNMATPKRNTVSTRKEITSKYITKKPPKAEKFGTGAKRGNRIGKGRFDLITPFLEPRLAGIYERGAVHYGDRNWEKGMPFSRFLDSAKRHLNQFERGLVDEDHLGQAIWNLACILHFQETRPDLDDLPKYANPTQQLPKRKKGKARS